MLTRTDTNVLNCTILGCGPSGGVPQVSFGWGTCDPNNPKNRRKRCSFLVTREMGLDKRTTILVDTGPDLHDQLLSANVSWVDAVLFTHCHADHVNGIDELVSISRYWKRSIDVYIDGLNAHEIKSNFPYYFRAMPSKTPVIKEHRIEPNHPFTINGDGGPVSVIPIHQSHGDIQSFGFRFGNLVYSCDLNGIMPDSLPLMADLDTWIVDAVQYEPHPAHFCVSDALAWIDRIRPRRAILTNLYHSLDYEKLRQELPPHVEPAYDGMKLTSDINCQSTASTSAASSAS
jgi:phosphoribosyl 1,2-cyclic phosphate phosphodiesterase